MFRLTAALLAAGWLVFAQQDRRPVALVVTGGTVVTMDGARILAPGAVAIDGRDIVAVDTADGVAARFRAADTIDATGDVVLPGLGNTHTHAPMVLYRGLQSGTTTPEPAARRAGIHLGIGTNGAASNNDLDMFDRKILTLNEAAVLQEARALAAEVRASIGR